MSEIGGLYAKTNLKKLRRDEMKAISKQNLLIVAAAAYCSCLIISNVIAGKTFDAGFASLPCAVIVFPIVYILNDVLTEVYGFKQARNIVLTGFALNLLAVIAYSVTIALPSSEFFFGQEAFATVLGSTPRLLIASLLAYLVGSLMNAKIMEVMKKRNEKALMLRCVASTLVGETIDATLFIGIAFLGTMPIQALVLMIAAQAAFKTVYEIIVYPITRKVISTVKGLPN